MTDRPSAREAAERDPFSVAERVYLALENLTGAQGIALIESALRRERAQGMREAAEIARNGCLVAPDGGAPTDEERQMCETIALAIERLA